MEWVLVDNSHEGFKVHMRPADANRGTMYKAEFNNRKRPWHTLEDAVKDGRAVMEQVRLRVLEEQHLAAARKAGLRKLANTSPANGVVPQHWPVPPGPQSHSSSCSTRQLQQQQPAAAASLQCAAVRGAVATAAANLRTPNAAGPLTGSLVRPCRCYHGALQGAHLLLGRLIGAGGFAEVYEGSPVDLIGNGSNLQAYPFKAAAAAAGTAARDGPAVRSRGGSLGFAVKVHRSSKEGVADNTLRGLAARELHALQLLRGSEMVVQLMAEGALVFTPGDITVIGSSGGSASSAHLAAAAGEAAGSCGGESYQRGCVVMELADMSLRQLLQHTGRLDERSAQAVAMQLLQLLHRSQSGALGYTITHRDLKPANLLVFAGGRLATADFGVCHIAKTIPPASAAAAAAAAANSMHTAIGTAFYAAPELCVIPATAAASPQPSSATAALDGLDSQQNGTNNDASSSSSSHGYGASVDVFALGVIVLEMLVGNLGSLFGTGELTTAQMMQQWEQRLQEVVDGEAPLPQGAVLSAAALEFIGCCCGVGRQRKAAAARGEPKRLTPVQLCSLQFITSFC